MPPARTKTKGIDPGLPWHGNDPILRKLRLKDLRKNGYINTGVKWQKLNLNATLPKHVKIFDQAEIHHLHPVFKRKNWIGITDQDYERLHPALRLASNLLFEPTILQFFGGMLRTPLFVIKEHPLATSKHGTLRRFRVAPYYKTDEPSRAETIKTWKQLSKLQDYVKWTFDETGCTWGLTDPNDGRNPDIPEEKGFYTGTWSSTVKLDLQLLHVLQGKIIVKDFPKAAHFDATAARLRTYLLTALTLLHEICHCIGFSILTDYPEPFFAEQRIAELGSAFETAVFGYVTYPMGHNSYKDAAGNIRGSAAAPYGVAMRNWPAAETERDENPSLATAAYWGAFESLWAPIEQADVHRLFTQQFWKQKVPMNDGSAFRWVMKVAVATPLEMPWLGEGEDMPEELVEPLWREASGEEELKRLGFVTREDAEVDSEDSDDCSQFA